MGSPARVCVSRTVAVRFPRLWPGHDGGTVPAQAGAAFALGVNQPDHHGRLFARVPGGGRLRAPAVAHILGPGTHLCTVAQLALGSRDVGRAHVSPYGGPVWCARGPPGVGAEPQGLAPQGDPFLPPWTSTGEAAGPYFSPDLSSRVLRPQMTREEKLPKKKLYFSHPRHKLGDSTWVPWGVLLEHGAALQQSGARPDPVLS